MGDVSNLLDYMDYSPVTGCTMDIAVEPENDGLVHMIFLFQGARILRFQPLIFRDVSETEKYFQILSKKEEIL